MSSRKGWWSPLSHHLRQDLHYATLRWLYPVYPVVHVIYGIYSTYMYIWYIWYIWYICIYGITWLIWLYMAAYGCIMLHMVAYGCIWLHMVAILSRHVKTLHVLVVLVFLVQGPGVAAEDGQGSACHVCWRAAA